MLSLKKTAIKDLMVIERTRRSDERGFFERMFCTEELGQNGFKIEQINHSFSKNSGTLRGLHYQLPPHCEDKIVSCLKGKILDVAVDIRHGSPTFMKWHGEVLSEENNKSLLIPKGFAHGFQTLMENCELIYLHSARYAPSSERRINPLDSAMKINWPITLNSISRLDMQAEMLPADFAGIDL